MSERTVGVAEALRMRGARWTAGELVHRRLPAIRNGSRRAADSDGESVETVSPETGSRASITRNGSRVAWSGGDVIPSSLEVSDEEWSLPLNPEPIESAANPVLTAADVTDYGDVDFVADPFLFPDRTGWNLFFEVFNQHREPTAVIAHATSDDGITWEYDRVVLESDVHLAFPYVFKWEGTYYMLPDRWDRDAPADVVLYRAESLTGGWEPVVTLVEPNRQLADCIVFRWKNRWWAMAGSLDGGADLYLFHSDDLTADEWTPHRENPVVTDRPEAVRPGGRPVVGDDAILVFFQDCVAQYGDKVRAFEVGRLSPTEYADREFAESPVLEASGRRLGWNSGRMHHVDAWHVGDSWLCAVDGNIGWGRRLFGKYHWAIGMYRT